MCHDSFASAMDVTLHLSVDALGWEKTFVVSSEGGVMC